MEELLNQIEHSTQNGTYLLGLYVALAMPDICSALESSNGRATGNRYKAWFNKWVSPKYDGVLTGEQCYAYRCGVLHQGRSKHAKLGYSRIIFLEPDSNMHFHRNILNDAFNLDLVIFCKDIVNSVREWLPTMENNSSFQNNYKHFMKRHEHGIHPYIVGVPVIG
jgi:hypothetical protein